MATKAKSKMAFGVATVMAQQNAFEARWLTFRRKLRGCIRELSFDGHKVRGCYIFPERRDGRRVLRRGAGLLPGDEAVGVFLSPQARNKIKAPIFAPAARYHPPACQQPVRPVLLLTLT